MPYSDPDVRREKAKARYEERKAYGMLPPRAARFGTGAPRGRPPAPPGSRRVRVEITVTAADLAALDDLVAKINYGGKHRAYNEARQMPQRGSISRSEAVRDALHDLLKEMT